MNINGDSARLLVGTGSRTAPSQGFFAEQNTGVYLDTPGSLSAYTVTKRGVKRIRVDDQKTEIFGPLVSEGVAVDSVSLEDGMLTDPSLNFADHPESGLYYETGSSPGLTVVSEGVRAATFLPNGDTELNKVTGYNFVTTSTDSSEPNIVFPETTSGVITNIKKTVASGLGSLEVTVDGKLTMQFRGDHIFPIKPILVAPTLSSTPTISNTVNPATGMRFLPSGTSIAFPINGTDTLTINSTTISSPVYINGQEAFLGVRRQAAQSIPFLTDTKVSWDVYDNPTSAAQSQNNWPTTFPITDLVIPVDGLYSFSYDLSYGASLLVKSAWIQAASSGTRRWAYNIGTPATGGGLQGFTGSYQLPLLAGDTISLWTWHSGAAALDISPASDPDWKTSLFIRRIGTYV